ncbi:hypothetical protein C8Q80DRAFT_1172658 [Daedaleopsis nitida]|nr:hypothetical protein C8Q80DRAFT_1172658 [Daedaleopsis nitida]
MATHDAYKVLGAGWGDAEALDKPHWLWFDTPLMTGIVSAIVQCYFSWRIYILSTSAILSGIICLIAFAQGCAAIATGIMSRLVNDNAHLQEKTLTSSVVWLVGSALCDILIALCMLYFLSRGKGGTVPAVLLSRLIHLTVETGILTASVACLDLILFVAVKHSNLHMTPALILTKVYTNTLLMLINNRARMRTMMRRESANISPHLQWVIDPANAGPTSPYGSPGRRARARVIPRQDADRRYLPGHRCFGRRKAPGVDEQEGDGER